LTRRFGFHTRVLGAWQFVLAEADSAVLERGGA
jgi:hypothetical protein